MLKKAHMVFRFQLSAEMSLLLTCVWEEEGANHKQREDSGPHHRAHQSASSSAGSSAAYIPRTETLF